MIDRRDVEDELVVDGNLRLPFERDEDERRGRREAFVPTGEGITDRRLDDAGAHDGAHDALLSRDQLLAQTLRVRVDVGPAPPLRALDAQFRQAVARPNFALARNGEAHRIEVIGIAPFFDQTLAPRLAEARRLQSIARLILHALGQLGAISDLLLAVELYVRQLFTPREVAQDGIALPHGAGAIARDETRRDVHERRPLHALRKRDDVLRADDVRSERAL